MLLTTLLLKYKEEDVDLDHCHVSGKRCAMQTSPPAFMRFFVLVCFVLTCLALFSPFAAKAQSDYNRPFYNLPSGSGVRQGQTVDNASAASVPIPQNLASTSASTHINSDSGAYHLDWNGSSGTMIRHALGAQPEINLSLTYLHTEPGPRGFAKYLTWFLARNNDHFAIVWCYLNDSGHEFACWLYQYPSNQLTTFRFVGDYQFAPLQEPLPAKPIPAMQFSVQPQYTGPDFTYRDWSRRSGKLDTLVLHPAPMASVASSLAGDGSSTPITRSATVPAASVPAPVVTLSNLRIYPLHEIHVASGNGWREGGWRELHAIAFDGAGNPYYLILYSNVTQGYVVDLKKALTYVADYGQKVVFSDRSAFGAQEEAVVGPPDVRIRRFSRIEIPLGTTHKVENPFSSIFLTFTLTSPSGKQITVPGYWDGGQTWRVRFAPTQIGAWSWRSNCLEEQELDKQSGTFTCIVNDKDSRGFITPKQGLTDSHAFAYADGTTFLPIYLREAAAYFSGVPTTAKTTDSSPTPALEAQKEPQSFQDFKKRVERAAALGFNRFWGGYVIDPDLFSKHMQVNEGGAPFVNEDFNLPNPAYFQWMDKRIAYCNEHGIIPDISFSGLNANSTISVSNEQIIRLWRYIIGRYASFNVSWNLFTASKDASRDKSYSGSADLLVRSMARVTNLYDPYMHPLTTVVPNAATALIQNTPGVPAGPLIITPDIPGGDIPILHGFDLENGQTQTGNSSSPVPAVQPGPAGAAARGSNPPVTGSANPSASNQRAGRGNRARGSRSTMGETQEPSDDYVVNVDPVVAEAVRADRRAARPDRSAQTVPDVLYANEPWLNVITLIGGDPNMLRVDYKLNKPLVWIDTQAADENDETRYHLWETLMQGDYWIAGSATGGSFQSLDSNITLWQVASAQLFQQTNYTRLTPHQEMLGGSGETASGRRRRRQAELESLQKTPSDSSAPGHGPNSIYVLADPGWEYVVYFEHGGLVTLDLLEATGTIRFEWFNPRTSQFASKSTMTGGIYKTFTAPDTNDWVLYLSRR